MSTDEAAGQREEGEYGRAAKRLKTDEPGPEDELEEGEDSDSGSLPGNGEAETRSRARWRGARKVRESRDLFIIFIEPNLPYSTAKTGAWLCACPLFAAI